ncbi:methyltransferase family protein [Nocardia yamanashiensis]|uniref:methyltransferase family protein n=1 Tax=Nocardia yamanashiensis TaxID=209247 RepID=UPI00082FA459|nr:isoprenylcysteine carboxylmethyltransferase family protein [Nocardia yamanashiensis]
MAQAALALYLLFGALGFGWRSWDQLRRTGSTGFRGISGRTGSVEWFTGVGFVTAILLGIASPALQLAGVLTPLPLLDVPRIATAGVLVAVVGIVATVYAQNNMGESWRIGVNPDEATTLVRTGVFALARNPIFTAMCVFAGGITLMIPNPLALAALAVLVLAIEGQVRIVEEPYLSRIHGQAYKEYTRRTGRFVPLVGRVRL